MDHYYISSTKYTLRQRETKNGIVYDVVFRVTTVDGYTKQKSLCGYQTKTLAKNAHKEFITKYCDLGIRPEPAQAPKRKITLSEAAAQYLESIKSTVKESTVYTIKNQIKVHVLPYFGNKDIKSITKEDIEDWIKDMNRKTKKNGLPYKKSNIARIKGFFGSMFEWIAQEYNIYNPVKAVKIKRTTIDEKGIQSLQYWTRDQFDQFLKVVDDPTYKTFFALLFFFGCRKGEAIALAPKDYDGDKIHIYKTFTYKTGDDQGWKITPRKQGKPYTAPVAKPLKKILDKYIRSIPKNQRFLFGEKPLVPTTIQRRFEQYTQAAGLPQIKIHGLRHSFVSMCTHYNANLMIVASLIGDTPEQVMKTYAHMWDKDQRDVVANIQ